MLAGYSWTLAIRKRIRIDQLTIAKRATFRAAHNASDPWISPPGAAGSCGVLKKSREVMQQVDSCVGTNSPLRETFRRYR